MSLKQIYFLAKTARRPENLRTIWTVAASTISTSVQTRSTTTLHTAELERRQHPAAAAAASFVWDRHHSHYYYYYSHPVRCFHASVPALLPVRRRRRGAKRIVDSETTTTTSNQNHNSNSSSSNDDIDDDDDNDGSNTVGALQHAFVQDTARFRQAAKELFDKLERALEPMKAKNDPFLITRYPGDIGEIFKLDLGPKEGFYQIEISEEEHVFEYSSPISGNILYCLSAKTGEWVGLEDGNAFEGIFVRDLIRQCQGLPAL